jgi:hypothetical protein
LHYDDVMQAATGADTAPTVSSDFRSAAAEQSDRLLRDPDSAAALNAPSSLCVRLPGNATGALYRIAVVPWLWIAAGVLLFLFGVVLAILILTPWVDGNWKTWLTASAAIVLGPVVLVKSPAFGDGVFEGTLRRRLGQRLTELEGRVASRHPFAVEDPATYKRQKVISEDYATGGLDRARPGLLLEGLRYRYVIRPRDVAEVRQDDDYLLITYAVGGAPVTLAVTLLIGDRDEEMRILAAIRRALSSP